MLLVEDEPNTVEYVRTVLADQHHALHAVGSLAGARRMLIEAKPDVVLLDLGLPDGDGLELVAEVADGRPEAPAVLVVSGNGLALERALELGARDFLHKPFRAFELRARVQAALRDRRSLVRLELTRRRARGIADRAQRLHALTAALSGTLNPEEAARTILDAASSAVGAWGGSIALLSEDSRVLRLVTEVGFPDNVPTAEALVDARMPGPEAVRRGRGVFVGDPARVRARYPDLEKEPTIDQAAVAGMPLVVDGRTIGALSLRFPAGPIPRSTRVFLSSLAGIGAQALDRARLYQQAQQEVAARRAAEEAARWREARFRTLIENSHDVTTVLSDEGIVLYQSPSVESVLGFTPFEMLGTAGFDLIHGDDRARVVDWLAAVPRGGAARTETPFRVHHKDGSWRWLESVATDASCVPEVGGIVMNSRDVTERVEREQRQRFQALLLDSVAEAAIATDTEGHIVYWNACAEHIYGWKSEEVAGRPILELITPPEGRAAAETAFARLISGEAWSGELPRRRRDGSTFQAAVTTAPVFDERDNLVGLVSLSVDLTEQKQAEAERDRLAQALTQLEERERIAMELHDGAIQGLYGTALQLSAAVRTLPEDTPARAGLARAVEDLNGVIRDIRAYVHGLSSTGHPEGLRAGFQAVLSRYRSAAVRVELVMAGRERKVEEALGPERIGHVVQVVSEAVGNAVRHGEPSRVTISVRWSQRRFVLEVVDDGRGFDPDDPDRPAGHGLANMAARGALAGGSLDVRSRQGGGTTVRLEIPLDAPPP